MADSPALPLLSSHATLGWPHVAGDCIVSYRASGRASLSFELDGLRRGSPAGGQPLLPAGEPHGRPEGGDDGDHDERQVGHAARPPRRREEEAGQGRHARAAQAAAQEEEGAEAARHVDLLGHPRVTGAELPRHRQADETCMDERRIMIAVINS